MAAHSAPFPQEGAEPFPAREKVYQLASFPDAAIGGSLSLGERVRVRILRKETSRLEPQNRQRRVGLGVLTPPPCMLDTLEGRGGVRTPSPTFRFVGRASVVSDLNRYELIQHLDPRIANLRVDVASAQLLKTDVTSARSVLDRRRVFSVVA